MTLYVTLRIETADESVQGLALALDEAKQSLAQRGIRARVQQVRTEDQRVVLGKVP